jgi:hypothetical protein
VRWQLRSTSCFCTPPPHLRSNSRRSHIAVLRPRQFPVSFRHHLRQVE